MVIASNICARVNIFETKYKITSYDRNLTNFFPQLLLEIFLKQKVLKIIHFWEKYYPIRHAGRDLSQKNYKRLRFLRASLHVYMSKKLVLFRFSFLFSVLKIACYLDYSFFFWMQCKQQITSHNCIVHCNWIVRLAYSLAVLDAQFERQTSDFLEDNKFIQV